MINAKELTEAVGSVAPFYTAVENDNCGLLIDCGNEFDRVIFALDATKEVLEEAAARGCGALVTHHPIIFGRIARLSSEDPATIAARLGISVVSAHTCFDGADGGVNDVLCDILGITSVLSFGDIGRVGTIGEIDEEAFLALCKDALRVSFLPVVRAGRKIKRVAVVGGAGGDYVELAASLGCNALVTGELRHHEALMARRLGMCAVSAGHFATEQPAIGPLCTLVAAVIGDKAQCIVSETCCDPYSYV